jgi:hypothetical protein
LPVAATRVTQMLTTALSLLLAFSVLAFGAVEDWSTAFIEVFLFTLLAVEARRNPGLFRFPLRLWAPFLFTAALLLLGLAQMVPLGERVWRIFGDERGTQSERAVEAEQILRSEPYRLAPLKGNPLADEDGPLGAKRGAGWVPVSFTPALTARAVWALLAALALILLLEEVSRGGSQEMARLGLVTGLLGLLVGTTALVQFRPGVERVMGFFRSPHGGNALGPFINENNGMGFLNPALGFLYYIMARRILKERKRQDRMGLLVIAGALFVAHVSLVAIRTSGAGLWPFLLVPPVVLIHSLRSRPRLCLALAGSGVIVLGCAVLFAWHYRFIDFNGRAATWHNLMMQNHWLLGNGLQSFSLRFKTILVDMPLHPIRFYVYPENEFLQLFFEGGLGGALLFLFAVAYVLVLGWRALLASGAVFTLVPVLWGEIFHAATDFQFHLWPVAFTYLILIATMEVSLGRRRREHSRGQVVQKLRKKEGRIEDPPKLVLPSMQELSRPSAPAEPPEGEG